MSEKRDFVYTTGHSQAARVGLPACECDDCAAEFRLQMLSKYPDEKKLAQVCNAAPALITHCARQCALDYGRRLYRRHEWLWSQSNQAQGEADSYDVADPDNVLDARFDHIAFQQLEQVSVTLSPQSIDYLRRFRDQQAYAEIASATGKSVNAVEQSVSRALKQLRGYFQKQAEETQNIVDICSPRPSDNTRDRVRRSSPEFYFQISCYMCQF